MDIKKFGFYFLLGIILTLAFKFYTIISGFVPAIASGCVLAYLFNPVYQYLHRIIRNRSIAAFIILFIVVTLILVPVTFIVITLQKQVQFLFTEQAIDNAKKALQGIDSFISSKFNISISEQYLTDILSSLVSTAREVVTAIGPRMLFSITRMLLMIFVTLFLLFYLLKNSKSVVRSFKDYFPINYKNSAILLETMGKDTKTLILGQFLIAVFQGALGGVGFFIFGVPRALLWGFSMVLASFIPFLGAAIIWVPAVIMLVAQKQYFSAAGLFLWGALVVGTFDNLIRPKLTSTLGTIHPVTVLLGVFIGIKEWGAIGLVVGPLFITVLVNLIIMFREEYLSE
ncbi:AI-2E family transporter [Candidatus Latescibacterota bacterium]